MPPFCHACARSTPSHRCPDARHCVGADRGTNPHLTRPSHRWLVTLIAATLGAPAGTALAQQGPICIQTALGPVCPTSAADLIQRAVESVEKFPAEVSAIDAPTPPSPPAPSAPTADPEVLLAPTTPVAFDPAAADSLAAARLEVERQERLRAVLPDLLRAAPIDPLIGSPLSLHADMVADDFAVGTDPFYDTFEPGHGFSVGVRFGTFSSDRITQNVITLPITYSYTYANHDRLILRMPLTYMEIDDAAAYRGAFSVSYKRTLSRHWALTPSLGYGVASSNDLGSLGHIFSTALTSDLLIYASERVAISMGNMLGWYRTVPIRYANLKLDDDLENTVTRHGLLFSIPMPQPWWGREFSLDLFANGTWYFGDALYTDSFQEVGFTLGPRRSRNRYEPNVASNVFGLGLKYIHSSSGDHGVEMNLRYRF